MLTISINTCGIDVAQMNFENTYLSCQNVYVFLVSYKPPAFAIYLIVCNLSDVIYALLKPLLAQCILFIKLYSNIIQNGKNPFINTC